MKTPPPSDGSAKIYGVTHRGTDGETNAYLEDGRVWISDGKGGWLQCNPGVEGYFSQNGADQPQPEIKSSGGTQKGNDGKTN